MVLFHMRLVAVLCIVLLGGSVCRGFQTERIEKEWDFLRNTLSRSQTVSRRDLSGYTLDAQADLVEDLPGWGPPTSNLFGGCEQLLLHWEGSGQYVRARLKRLEG